MDFILAGATTQRQLDAAMASVGFVRKSDRFVHPRVTFYVEFPRGPLAIGGDYRIKPVERRGTHGRALILSATDSCRDRLAAFFDWRDRGSLDVAVAIALRNPLRCPSCGAGVSRKGSLKDSPSFCARCGRPELSVSLRDRPPADGSRPAHSPLTSTPPRSGALRAARRRRICAC
jgi:hypothetical protein